MKASVFFFATIACAAVTVSAQDSCYTSGIRRAEWIGKKFCALKDDPLLPVPNGQYPCKKAEGQICFNRVAHHANKNCPELKAELKKKYNLYKELCWGNVPHDTGYGTEGSGTDTYEYPPPKAD